MRKTHFFYLTFGSWITVSDEESPNKLKVSLYLKEEAKFDAACWLPNQLSGLPADYRQNKSIEWCKLAERFFALYELELSPSEVEKICTLKRWKKLKQIANRIIGAPGEVEVQVRERFNKMYYLIKGQIEFLDPEYAARLDF